MSLAVWELQKAVYDELKTDVTLMGKVEDIYQHTPQGADYPFVVINAGSSSDWSTKTTTGWEIQLSVRVYDRSRGSKNSLEIQERIRELLDGVELTLGGGFALIDLRFRTSDLLLRADGATYQAGSRFRALVQENA